MIQRLEAIRERHLRVKKLRQEGLSISKIGREVGVTRQQVSNLLRQMGEDPARQKRRCAQCGKLFQPRMVSNKFCSPACTRRAEFLKRVHEQVCLYCTKTFQRSRAHMRYCSEACAQKGIRRRIHEYTLRSYRARRSPPLTGTCLACGRSFTVSHGRLFCSLACREASSRQVALTRLSESERLFLKELGEGLTVRGVRVLLERYASDHPEEARSAKPPRSRGHP